jgi:DNA-binding response OmpR family regulator
MSKRLLVVDDEERIRKLLSASLGREGYEVVLADGADAAFREVAAAEFDLVVMDLNMPGMNGLEGIRSIRLVKPDQPVLVLTGYSSDRIREQAIEAGADECLFKPARQEDLLAAVERLTAS